jgi:hypothetical protein
MHGIESMEWSGWGLLETRGKFVLVYCESKKRELLNYIIGVSVNVPTWSKLDCYVMSVCSHISEGFDG